MSSSIESRLQLGKSRSIAAVNEGTTLFHAAQRGELTALTNLLDEGLCKATDTDFQNVTALHWAAINNRKEIMLLLLERGAVVDARGGDLLATPLHWACRKGHVMAVAQLLAANAQANMQDGQGFNALHLAVHSGNVFLVQFLTTTNVNINSIDLLGHTALMWAAYQGDAVSVGVLLGAGADVNMQDQTGFTALHWAVSKGHRGAMEKLIRAGIDTSICEGKGRTAKDLAVELGQIKVYEIALKSSVKSKRLFSEVT